MVLYLSRVQESIMEAEEILDPQFAIVVVSVVLEDADLIVDISRYDISKHALVVSEDRRIDEPFLRI